ncbi:CBS domain containing-hemolysin-like protein [Deinobacterium chartae]|uniref:CBS domain containing-hemolysin-like protein n=1 Tax=Deinobacterium chartae TaxID=521158 RepID=A0A841HZL1_9DEIO|nr:hemolysin family protein [Deinobacterium chartae]MBB6098383.1 CBS domain containing-hemolysin-like protein [Deinobacterium chartae]
MLLKLAAALGLVFLNGFFVATEFALIGVRRTRIDQLAEEGNSSAKLAQGAVRNLDLYIAGTQLGITMASLGLGWLGEPTIGRMIEAFLHAYFPALEGQGWVRTIEVIIAFGLITTLHIVLGELAPKTLALQRPTEISLLVIRPMIAFIQVFRWAIQSMNWLGNRVVRTLGLPPVPAHASVHTEEELKMLVSASRQEGVLEENEKELLYNVFDLSDKQVREIMTPRVDMVAVPSDMALDAFVSIYEEHGYSRVPVYSETIDNIVGIVYARDLIKYRDALAQTVTGQIMQPTYYAPESMNILDIFKIMQSRKIIMSVVVDEFGGTAGIVTLEDVLEEIVGEIYDETDEEEEKPVQHLGEGVYLLDAGLHTDEVEEVLGIRSIDEDDEADYDTLSGFIYHRFGYIPRIGETTEYAGWRFEIIEGDERRVTKIRAERTEPAALEAAPE